MEQISLGALEVVHTETGKVSCGRETARTAESRDCWRSCTWGRERCRSRKRGRMRCWTAIRYRGGGDGDGDGDDDGDEDEDEDDRQPSGA